jgi:hypothetical protein
MAYIKSPLFKASLSVSKQFKLISDMTRLNEEKMGRRNEYAGANFIKVFLNETKNYDFIEKVKTMIFCGNK